MHKTMEVTERLCKLQDKLIEAVECECGKGLGNVNTAELGEAIDMIKDLSEAKEKLFKACYYKSVIKAMEDYEEDMGDGEPERYGYDHWRYSSGRYAPKGHGHRSHIRSGYPIAMNGDPNWTAEDYEKMYDEMRNPKLGYVDPDMQRIEMDREHGRPYKMWKMAKRHYTETKAEGDRKEMSEHAKQHLADTVTTVKEIWVDADPELRDKMKKDITVLLNEMK